MKPITTVYMRILQEIAFLFQHTGKSFPTLQDKQKDFDITAAVRLKEAGYPASDIRKVLLKNSPYVLTLHGDAAKTESYLSDVFQHVNKEWRARSANLLEAATDCYQKRADAMLGKYEEYQPETFGIYQDGQIGIAMMEKDGFPKDTVKEVLRRETRTARPDEGYFDDLSASLDAVHDRYAAISAFDLSQPITNEREMYLKFAKKRMMKNGGALLSGGDDQKIFRSIYAQILRGMRKAEKDPALLPELVEKVLKPAIIKSVRENSPVYAEAGRNQDLYLTSLLTELRNHIQEQKKMHSKDPYTETTELFEKFAADYEQSVTHKLTFQSNPFRDGVIAKKLLEARQAPELILRAIEEHTYFHLDEDGKFETLGAYAKHVLHQAEESLHAEKMIQNFEIQPIPEDTPLSDAGLSIKDLYRQMLKERIETYPSFGMELSESFADRDAVEKLFHRFPSADRLEVKEAILSCSPRAQLPGIPDTYADSILRLAESRLERAETRKKEQMTFEKNFNKLRGLSTEGVMGQSPMNRIKDGKIAMKMLRQHVPKDDILSFLVKFSKETAEKAEKIPAKKAFLYAAGIVAAAELVLHREQVIALFNPLLHAQAAGCQNDFLGKLHEQYAKDPTIRTDNDVQAMRAMLLEKKYPRKEIKEALLSVSPTAAEPGRDRGYADYVEQMADASIRRDKEKFQNYVLIPPEQPKETAKEAYQYQKEQLERAIPLPYSAAMDARIAKELLDEGYPREEVEQVLDEESPLADLEAEEARKSGFDVPEQQESFADDLARAAGYGFAILHVVKEITEEIVKQSTQTEEKVLSRSITEKVTSYEEPSS